MNESKGPALTKDQAIDELTKLGAEFEVGSKRINGVKIRFFKNIPQTLPEYYRIYCDEFAERPSIVWYDARWTYKEAYQKGSIVAHKLRNQMGVGKGDRVAIACRNYPEWIFAFLGITSIGAIAVAVNAWWQGKELEYGLTDSGARILFADQERANRLGDRLGKLGVETIVIRPEKQLPGVVVSFDDFMANAEGVKMPEASGRADSAQRKLQTDRTGRSGLCGHTPGKIQGA